MNKEFKRTAKNLAIGYEQGGEISAQFEIRDHKLRVEEILKDSYKPTMNTFGARVLRGFKSIYSFRTKAVPVSEKTWEELRDEWIGINAKGSAEVIGNTTFGNVTDIIQRGLRENLSNIDIAEMLSGSLGGVAEHRALRIARTEVHSASQAATNEMAKTLTITVNKQWISASDERVRTISNGAKFDHVAANGETVKLGKNFQKTGQPMDYPGWKGGSVANFVNCRCVVIMVEEENEENTDNG